MPFRSAIALRDYSDWDTLRIRRARRVYLSLAVASALIFVAGCAGLALWVDTPWHAYIDAILVVAGGANLIVFGGAAVRATLELRTRRNPMSGV